MNNQTTQQTTIGILDEFQAELVEGWHRLPNKGFFFLLLGAWLALFQFVGNSTFGFFDTSSLLKWMYIVGTATSAEGETDDNQMIIAPLIVIGLFWWKRKELLRQPMATWWPGLLLVGLGLVLHIVGFRVQQPRISIVALFTGIYGLMGLAWGPKLLRASFFPFFLFAFCLPFGTLAEFITVPLRYVAMQLVEVIAHTVLRFHVIRQGTQLIDPSGHFQYEVAAACGGIRSLIVTVMLAIVFGFVVFRSWWKRALLIALAPLLAIAGNVLRLLFIIIAAEWFGGQSAGKSVHDSALFSLLPYVPAVLALFWLGDLLEKKKTTPAEGVASA
ncbi:MAG TPA: exosortase/archaeosortase family protein [Verrucomicrobiae bacterium]|nr:exosortase/archaeosortase family protein [Verrucomicrobiae bacterium]